MIMPPPEGLSPAAQFELLLIAFTLAAVCLRIVLNFLSENLS